MALDAQILLSILAHETSSGDISRTLRATPASYSLSLSDGTGANQAQVVWSDSRTIADGGDDTPNVAGLTDDRGTVAFTAVKLIYIRNTGSVPLNLIGNGDWATGPQKLPDTSNYEIPAGGCWLATNPTAAGWSVGASPKYLTIANQSASTAATYEIVLVGEGTVT
jgi:hypothetical protein